MENAPNHKFIQRHTEKNFFFCFYFNFYMIFFFFFLGWCVCVICVCVMFQNFDSSILASMFLCAPFIAHNESNHSSVFESLQLFFIRSMSIRLSAIAIIHRFLGLMYHTLRVLIQSYIIKIQYWIGGTHIKNDMQTHIQECIYMV